MKKETKEKLQAAGWITFGIVLSPLLLPILVAEAQAADTKVRIAKMCKVPKVHFNLDLN